MPANVSVPEFSAVENAENVCCCQNAGAQPAAAHIG
jgi:hypothetical protein